MRSIRTIMGAALLGCSLAACTATDGVEKRDAGTNPPAQVVEAASPGDGSPSTTEEGDITSRRVLPSDPCLSSPDINCRNRLNQSRELQQQLRNPTMTPVIPPVPANGGRCVIDVKGQYGLPLGQPGAKGSYSHFEVQLWTVSSTPMPMQSGAAKSYSVQWTTSGSGNRYDDNGVGTRDSWTWSITGTRASSSPNPMSGEPRLTVQKIASTGQWQILLAQASFPDGVVTTQQHNQDPPSPPMKKLAVAVDYLRFGQVMGMPIVESMNSMMQKVLTVNEWSTLTVDANLNVNRNYANVLPTYQSPLGPKGAISCTWNFNVVNP